MTKYLIGLAVILAIALTFSVKTCKDNKADADRQSANMEQITWDHNRELTLTKYEYSKLQGEFKTTLDSVNKANDIKLKQVKQATLVKTKYVDTTKVTAHTGIPVPLPLLSIPSKLMWSLPVFEKDSCWGVAGEIITTDINAKLNILKRSTNNRIQLIVTVPKYFLGFLWRTRKGAYNAFSDCGEVDVTNIQFKK